MTIDGFQLFKFAILAAAIAIILLVNWHLSRVFFIFRNRRPSNPILLLFGFAMISVTLIAPFIAMSYLSAWVFNPVPGRSTLNLIYFAIGHLSWMILALVITLRNSAKYWTNRS